MKKLKFILSGGGTGGHIYPAIAIANELKSRFPDAEFLFVGAKDKMEMQKVPQAGYKIEGLWIAGLQRKLTVQNMMFPFKLISSLWKSRQIINKFKPDVVIGTGGFASGPLLQVANSRNIPTVVQEQNSYPGITNKLLSKKANKICVAYENLERFFPKEKIVLTGNPVREDLLNIDA
ncbi:MAG TPA: glycosyltransferase, partial [Flavobacterium sp.]|nr:glycosyltransferase [Flavobacterium sp.]